MDGRGEAWDDRLTRALPALFLIVGAILHAAYVTHHRVNTDEPQHLHVAWAWVHGLLPYRDVFDNHSPLFSLLMAPIVGAIGERPDIVILARLAMIPFALYTLLMTWVIGRHLFSGRQALLSVALAALMSDFMLGSIEYRTDQLWTALWMTTMAVLLLGRMTRARSFLFGLAVGSAVGASMKTSLWILSVAAGLAASVVLLRQRGVSLRPRWLGERAGLALSGMVIVPGLLAAFFAAQGAWRPMVYCVLWHNVVPSQAFWHMAWYRALLVPVALPLLWIVARRIVDGSPDPSKGARRVVLFLTAGFYYVALLGFWPLVTRQDVLPFLPLGAVMAAPALLGWADGAARRWAFPSMGRVLKFVPALALVLEIAWTQHIEAVWRDNDVSVEVSFLRQVLRLTRPGETIMDLRGEAVFRPRPYYFALEAVTLSRIASGLLPDDISAHLIAARTSVVVPDWPEFPARSRTFMNENYLPYGDLRIAGKSIGHEENGTARRFEIEIPQRYAVVGEHGPAKGLLDGTPYIGPRELAPGWHAYDGPAGEGQTTVVWSDAVARAGWPSTIAP